MKVVVWCDANVPDPVYYSNRGNEYTIEDCMFWDDLELGDLVQHISEEFGCTKCYLVIGVEDADPELFAPGIKLVSIREAIVP